VQHIDRIMSLHSYGKVRNALGSFKVYPTTSDTESERESAVTICQEHLDRASEDENFLKRIIAGNETRVYGCENAVVSVG
jgi:hypothetical protein